MTNDQHELALLKACLLSVRCQSTIKKSPQPFFLGVHAMRPRAGIALLLVLSFFCCTWSSAGDQDKNAKDQKNGGLPKELAPKLFTLQGKDLEMAKVLVALGKQTGNAVEDRRASKEGTKLKIDLKNVTFWQALDAIAKEADAKVSLYERDGKLALVDGPYLAMPVSYAGLFRVAIKRLDISHILEMDAHTCVITLEVAWEPRFQPLLMETQPDSMEIRDDKGRTIDVPEGGKGKGAVGHRNVGEVQVRIPAPQRTANNLAIFKGKLSAVGPTEMVTFTFDKLDKIQKREQARKLTQKGVTVHLRELRPEQDGEEQIWMAGLMLEYPADGPKFESFQSWLLSNEIYLEKEVDGVLQRFPKNLGEEIGGGDDEDNKAVVRYRFGDQPEKNLVLGKISDWKLVYRTPGKIAEVPIPFEFKDLPLP
jgi:hypothetical protein